MPYSAFYKGEVRLPFLTVKGAEEHNSFGEEYQGISECGQREQQAIRPKEKMRARKREAMLKRR